MARNDGIDRTNARNVNLTAAKIGNARGITNEKKNPIPTQILYRNVHLRISILRSPPPDM